MAHGDGNSSAREEDFLEWAETKAVPIATVDPEEPYDADDFLESLATTSIGDAQVVVLSEGFHNCQEMMALHHRIIRYLVEHHGFTAVITESGLPESRRIHNYIQGKDDCNTVYIQGLNKMYSEWVEGRDLIEWMRKFNEKHANCLAYYGSDIGGFYQDWKTPFESTILEYLSTVDASFHQRISQDLKPYLDLMSQDARLNYQEKLSRTEKARLEVILDEALETMDSKRDAYIATGRCESDFEWARQSLESMRLAEQYYQNYQQRCSPQTSKFVGLNVREIAMHRNTLWALEQERRRSHKATPKAIVISHVIHTKTESQYQGELWGIFTPAGQIIKQSLGEGIVFAIGMVYGGGEYWKDWQKGRNVRRTAPIPPNGESGLESTLGKLSKERYFLPWRSGPESWLSSLCSMRENDYFINIRPREWDACIFLKEVHPSTPV